MNLGLLGPRARGRLLAVAAVTACVVGATAEVASAAPAVTDVEFDCAAGTVTVTSNKNISNVVVAVDGVETKAADLTGLVYVIDLGSLEGLTAVWVKSGNNSSGDGSGYGKKFVFDYDATCDPDADGDGYPVSTDCNDADPAINPGVPDIPNNDVDENCDGSDLIVGDGKIRVTLIWGNDDDLDLFVTDPNGDRVGWNTPAVPSGGTLDRDDNLFQCGTDPEPGGVENIIWPDLNTTGTYTVQLSSYIDCAIGTSTDYTIEVWVDSVLVHTESGTVDSNSGSGETVVDSFTFTV
jgi:hypothetical protein